MTNEARRKHYEEFCKSNYVPIYSQPWWLDVVCSGGRWDVWLYDEGGQVAAAMPYYIEEREHGLYITKAPLTQNNGIVFSEDPRRGSIAEQKFQERVIRSANAYLESLELAVYEQQYQTSFRNWLPFSWLGYDALPRYTYVIERSKAESGLQIASAKQRSVIRKGRRNTSDVAELDARLFYDFHKKVFERQGLECPFSRELFLSLESACRERECCATLAAQNANGDIASVLYLVWDERRAYHILGGTMPGWERLDTYAALIWHAINMSHGMGLDYDFEGSMIERISKSFREFGGEPELYFRIRKVFSPDVIREEAEAKVQKLRGIL